MRVGSMGHAMVSLADTASVPHSVPYLADRATLSRFTKHAPRGALRQRQQPSSAWLRQWRSNARSVTSRCSSSYLYGSAALTRLDLRRVSVRLMVVGTACERASMGHLEVELSCREGKPVKFRCATPT